MASVAKWEIFELELKGPAAGNPYLDVTLEATFSQGARSVRVPGFYDGDGIFRIRFMPDAEGKWTYTTKSSAAELSGKIGALSCTPAAPAAHGPVRVHNQFHFAHADGAPYFPFGTTCYAWTHQPQELQAVTLGTLKSARFNKVRMGVFPNV